MNAIEHIVLEEEEEKEEEKVCFLRMDLAFSHLNDLFKSYAN
jgi:hypothetical protein